MSRRPSDLAGASEMFRGVSEFLSLHADGYPSFIVGGVWVLISLGSARPVVAQDPVSASGGTRPQCAVTRVIRQWLSGSHPSTSWGGMSGVSQPRGAVPCLAD
jgi:hypothetical protein